MELQEISDLLDTKLRPIADRLSTIEKRLGTVEEKIDNVLAFVSVGNEDLTKELKRLKKVSH
ncbi:MAG TPA: hypothetical protein VGN20_02075 [Mucilaginibacter sp.]|jgi:hypothetical protein